MEEKKKQNASYIFKVLPATNFPKEEQVECIKGAQMIADPAASAISTNTDILISWVDEKAMDLDDGPSPSDAEITDDELY